MSGENFKGYGTTRWLETTNTAITLSFKQVLTDLGLHWRSNICTALEVVRTVKMALWYQVLGWFLSVITIVGNGMVISLITTRPRLHTTANYFILSLCVADFSVGLALFPPLFACDVWSLCNTNITTPMRWFFLHVSIINICTMTADRYLAIVKSLRYVSLMTERRVFCLVSFSWGIPIICFLIPFTILYTGNEEAALRDFFTFVVIVLEFLPIAMLVFMTARILLITWKSSHQIAAQVSQVRFNHVSLDAALPSRRRNRLRSSARVTVLIVVLFFLCYTFDIYFIFCDSFQLCSFPPQLRSTKHLFLITNSAVNPWAYAFFKSDIRKEMKKLFCRMNTGTS